VSDDVPPPSEALSALTRLKGIIDRLRAPDGCPWDREQTPESLIPFLLEEAHEATEAIEGGDPVEIRGELGDLLMNIFLQARIAEERGSFTLSEIAEEISEKLIRRHPHVFGDGVAEDSDAVRRNWEAIKRREQGTEETEASVLRPLPASLPALARGDRIGRMAAELGFDWPNGDGPLEKIGEELVELRQVHAGGDPDRIESEVGDLLFAATSYCRKQGIDPERALRGSLERFARRFQRIESELRSWETSGRKPTPEDLDRLWESAKSAESRARRSALPGAAASGGAGESEETR